VVECADLQYDRLAAMTGAPRDPRIVPFRGEYWRLRASRTSLVRGLIYPVPDPAFPFLGVHFARRVDGEVWIGPNAMLAMAREGYRRRQVSVTDAREMLAWAGFYRMLLRYWGTGVREFNRALRKPALVAEL